jgi:acyl-coenzyme A thioesterase PaaI-like protein
MFHTPPISDLASLCLLPRSHKPGASTLTREIAVQPIMTPNDIDALLAREYPQFYAPDKMFETMHVGPATATLRFTPSHAHLRAGGTISGPSLFALADVGAYITLLAHIGPVVGCVTANLNIHFLNRADPVPVDGIGRILKLGRKLAILDVTIERPDTGQIIAKATTTFAIPSQNIR